MPIKPRVFLTIGTLARGLLTVANKKHLSTNDLVFAEKAYQELQCLLAMLPKSRLNDFHQHQVDLSYEILNDSRVKRIAVSGSKPRLIFTAFESSRRKH
jgi:hypothetical protein